MIIVNLGYTDNVTLAAGESLTVTSYGDAIVTAVSGGVGSGVLGTVDGTATFGPYVSAGVISIQAKKVDCSYQINPIVPAFLNANSTALLGPDGLLISLTKTYTWAQIQSLTGMTAGQRVIASDLNNAEFVYNGTDAAWYPASVAVLSRGALPLLYPPSGSFANNGVLTLGTALSGNWYPKCYMRFPDGAVFSGSAAGWYYTEMSSTTAAIVYNNVYVSGQPRIPVKVAFAVTGPGAYVQTTGVDIPALQYQVPANLMAPYGSLDCDFQMQMSNNANAKTLKGFMGGVIGSQFATFVMGGNYGFQGRMLFRNAGDRAVNWGDVNNTNGWAMSAQPLLPTYQNMAAVQMLTIAINMAVATDAVILVGHRLDLS